MTRNSASRPYREYVKDFYRDRPISFWTIVVLVLAAIVPCIIWPSAGAIVLVIIGGIVGCGLFIWWLYKLIEEWME